MLSGVSGYLLEIVEGPDAGQTFRVDEPLDIGREAGAGVVLMNDELVSRRHARLSPKPEGVVLEDLASRNGTFVNGTEIYSPVIVGQGDEITIGVTVLEVHPATQSSHTGVRRVPEGLTSAGRAPLAVPGPGLAVQERLPDYLSPGSVSPDGRGPAPAEPSIHRLLDVHTKHKAKTAPLAIFVLVCIVVIIALALR
jgi:pSer/pThr/pTyr-binding forkhead associated (FHA) protein